MRFSPDNSTNSNLTRCLLCVLRAMPDADVVVMEDLRYALECDADLGSDFFSMHPLGIHLEDSLHQSRSVGDFVGYRDALLL